MATFVLVHGGWHGGWCWRKVVPLLRTAGHEVYTPTLTGLGERAHLLGPEVDLEMHVRDLLHVLEFEDLTAVVLVGHSYGGMVIGAVAERAGERVGQLIYLDAFVPDDGQALLDLLPGELRDAFLEQARTVGEGWRVPCPSPERYGVTDEADLAWVRPRLLPQPLATFSQPAWLERTDRSRPRRAYIACIGSAAVATLRPFAERARADPGWGYRELVAGHDAMITTPRELAALLLEVAG